MVLKEKTRDVEFRQSGRPHPHDKLADEHGNAPITVGFLLIVYLSERSVVCNAAYSMVDGE